MDDRFDRRELLLHLGDMLEALSCSTKAGWPDAPVARLAKERDSLHEFGYLRALARRCIGNLCELWRCPRKVRHSFAAGADT